MSKNKKTTTSKEDKLKAELKGSKPKKEATRPYNEAELKYTKVIAKCKPLKDGSKQQLLTPYGEHIKTRPTVITLTDFIKGKIALDIVEVFAKGLPMEASDLEFSTFIKESKGDIELAIDSYCSKFAIHRDGTPIEVETK